MSNKKETTSNKKTYIIFAVVVILSMVGGFFAAMFMNSLKSAFGNIDKQGIIDCLYIVTPIVFAAAELILFVSSFISLKKTKRLIAAWDGEDEDGIYVIEERLNTPLLLTNIGMIFAMLMFGICMYLTVRTNSESMWLTLVGMLVFVFSFAYIMPIQATTVNLEKKLNPEKKGNVYDMKFAKTWEDSLDEAEKLEVYQAGAAAYKAGNFTCTLLWLVTIFSILMFDGGLLALIVVCIIWFVMTITYINVCMKLEKRK